jgi:hypothetical protein
MIDLFALGPVHAPLALAAVRPTLRGGLAGDLPENPRAIR